jgi:hypothetical protein
MVRVGRKEAQVGVRLRVRVVRLEAIEELVQASGAFEPERRLAEGLQARRGGGIELLTPAPSSISHRPSWACAASTKNRQYVAR